MKNNNWRIAFLIVVYLVIALIIRLLIPDMNSIVQMVERAYGTYGYPFLYVFALLEGIFLIGMFITGTAIVMLGATLAAKGLLSLPLVILAATLGLLSGSAVSYWAGRMGWHKMLTKVKGTDEIISQVESMHSQASWITFISFASTGIGAVIATAAGALRVEFRKFIVFAAAAHLFWVTVWSTIAYLFGVYIGNTFIAFGGVLVVIMAITIGLQWYVKKKGQQS